MLSEKTAVLVDNSCQPGDITVTKIHTGFLLGRALPQDLGPGPWWEYIAVVSKFTDAVHHATTIASQDNVRAWLHGSGDRYELLPT